MFLILTTFLIVTVITFCFYKYLKMWRYIEKFRGPKPLPLIGNAHQMGRNPTEYLANLLKWRKKYGNVYRVWIGSTPYVVTSDPKDVEAILSSNTLLDKADAYDLLRPWLGEGLLTSTGSKWHKHRKMITPSFHFKILVDFLVVMNENASKFIEKLNDKANNEKIFDIQEMIHFCTLDVICETAMGVNLNSMDNPKSDIVTAFQDMCYTIQLSVFDPVKRNPITFKLTEIYRKQQKALEILKNFTLEVINKRREKIENSIKDEKEENVDDLTMIKNKKAFLDNLLTATIDGRPLTSQEIFEEVSTFMFEGHDTTTSGIAFAVYVLSRHPDIQKSIYEEQKNIFGNDINKRHPTYQEIQDMKYLDLVIKEVQRLYPSVPIIGRYCTDEFNLNGKIIPKYTAITILIIAMGYNEKYFKDPLKFDVTRFDPLKREKINPFEYVPFSAGPRNCIGQKFAILEMKSVLSSIVRNFEILPPVDDLNEIDRQKYDPILAAVLTLKSENGIQIRLKKREKL